MNEPARPLWLSDGMFPIVSRWFATPYGQRMHYVDEGAGPVIVFLQGNPSWSFQFRHLIGELRSDSRCIGVDHADFGLSSRSQRREVQHPQVYASQFSLLKHHLNVKDATLCMTDWGGPIGL